MTDESASASSDESPDDPATEPIDPARPAETDVPDSAQPPNGSASARSDGAGVAIPSWLAGALVVVLALVVAGAGFALGRVTAPDDGHDFRPAVVTQEGGRGGGQTRVFPLPGGPNGMPGFPDQERGGPDGGQGRGDDGSGPRAYPGERDRTYPGDDGSDQGDDDSSDAPTPPSLPGT
jgi:hypothetical protein